MENTAWKSRKTIITVLYELVRDGHALSLFNSTGRLVYLASTANSQQVFFVGNNWDGTVTVIRSSGDFGKVGVINMIPDRKERLKKFISIPLN